LDIIIYRKSDALIAGYTFPRRTSGQTQSAVALEIYNICQSELGGVPDDYAQVQLEQSQQSGFRP
jgi:hypothetical protein